MTSPEPRPSVPPESHYRKIRVHCPNCQTGFTNTILDPPAFRLSEKELDDLDSCITDSLTLMEEKDQGMTEEDVDYQERLDALREKLSSPAASPLLEEPPDFDYSGAYEALGDYPPDLKGLLRDILRVGRTCCGFDPSTGETTIPDNDADIDAGCSRVLALFDRQREESVRWTTEVPDPEWWAPQSLVTNLERQVASLESQLERLSKPNVCNVCAGSGKPTSGLPCICGGVGTEVAELEGFRAQYYELSCELERLKAEQISREELAFLVGVGEPKDHCFAWGCFCVRCKDMKAKLHRRLAQAVVATEELKG